MNGLSRKTRYVLIDLVALSAMFVFVQFAGTLFAIRQRSRLSIGGATDAEAMQFAVVGQVGGIGVALVYVFLLLVMTGVILVLIKYGVAGILSYVGYFIVFTTFLGGLAIIGLPILLALAGAVAAVTLYHSHRTWYVLTGIGLVLSVVTVGAFGAAWSPVALVTLLILLSIYDFAAVYVTGHMQTLARGASDKLPLLVVIPHHLDVSLAGILEDDKDETDEPNAEHGDTEDIERRVGTVLGIGDLVIPSTLLPAASRLGEPIVTVLSVPVTVPFIGGMLGTLAGVAVLVALLYYVESDGHAGLPPLNAGVLLGIAIGSGAVGAVSLVALVP